MFLITRDVDGNKGQCFLYEGHKLIAFHMYLQCLSTLILDTRQIECDKTSKSFSLDKVLFHIFVSFSLQIPLDLYIRNRMKLRSQFCFL